MEIKEITLGFVLEQLILATAFVLGLQYLGYANLNTVELLVNIGLFTILYILVELYILPLIWSIVRRLLKLLGKLL